VDTTSSSRTEMSGVENQEIEGAERIDITRCGRTKFDQIHFNLNEKFLIFSARVGVSIRDPAPFGRFFWPRTAAKGACQIDITPLGPVDSILRSWPTASDTHTHTHTHTALIKGLVCGRRNWAVRCGVQVVNESVTTNLEAKGPLLLQELVSCCKQRSMRPQL
jgi:hypothetical protein